MDALSSIFDSRRSYSSPEHGYVDMMFDACHLYASWDPRNVVELGDYGKLSDAYKFTREGNIFEDGLAKELGIASRNSADSGMMFIMSSNLSDKTSTRSKSPAAGGSSDYTSTGLKQKRTFKLSGNQGAILALVKPEIHRLTAPGQLSYLVYSEPCWKDRVIVSELYICQSFARLYVSKQEGLVNIGLYSPDSSMSDPAKDDIQWHTTADLGGDDWRFLCQGVTETAQSPCYPLFKLVGRRDFLQSGPFSRLKKHSSRPLSTTGDERLRSPSLERISSPSPERFGSTPRPEATQEESPGPSAANEGHRAARPATTGRESLERRSGASSPRPSDEDANTAGPSLSQKHRTKSNLSLNLMRAHTSSLVSKITSVYSSTFSNAAASQSPRP